MSNGQISYTGYIKSKPLGDTSLNWNQLDLETRLSWEASADFLLHKQGYTVCTEQQNNMFGMDEPPFRLPKDFDGALLGETVMTVTCDVCLSYDYDKCILIYMTKHLMTKENAEVSFSEKYLRQFLGNDTPVFIITNNINEDKNE